MALNGVGPHRRGNVAHEVMLVEHRRDDGVHVASVAKISEAVVGRGHATALLILVHGAAVPTRRRGANLYVLFHGIPATAPPPRLQQFVIAAAAFAHRSTLH